MEIREGHNKFYINDKQGKQIAEIVFVPTGENLAIIEHTDVDESLKGQGIGKQLVAKVVEKMRREKRKIIPLCPFAKHEFDKTGRSHIMEGKNKFNTYVVSFDYPSSYSSVFLRLRSLMYDMNFSSIVADEYGIPRQLNENSFAITTSLAASEIEDLIRLKCLDLPDIDFDLNIMTVDDYFRQFYK